MCNTLNKAATLQLEMQIASLEQYIAQLQQQNMLLQVCCRQRTPVHPLRCSRSSVVGLKFGPRGPFNVRQEEKRRGSVPQPPVNLQRIDALR